MRLLPLQAWKVKKKKRKRKRKRRRLFYFIFLQVVDSRTYDFSTNFTIKISEPGGSTGLRPQPPKQLCPVQLTARKMIVHRDHSGPVPVGWGTAGVPLLSASSVRHRSSSSIVKTRWQNPGNLAPSSIPLPITGAVPRGLLRQRLLLPRVAQFRDTDVILPFLFNRFVSWPAGSLSWLTEV